MHSIEKEVMRVSYLDGDMEGFGKKGKETNTIIIFYLKTLNIFFKTYDTLWKSGSGEIPSPIPYPSPPALDGRNGPEIMSGKADPSPQPVAAFRTAVVKSLLGELS